MDGVAPSILDLCRPGMPVGSLSPARKIVQLLSYTAAGFCRGRQDVLDSHVVAAAIEAFAAWKHRRCARASLELFTSEPFALEPVAQSFTPLLADACRSQDPEAGDAVLEKMRLWCVKPDKFLFTSMIGFHGMAGRLDRVKETLQEMDAAGFKPDRVTTLLLLGEILSTQTTVEKLEETMAVLASSGVVVDVAHWTTALRHFRQHGDFAGLVRVWKAMSVPPDDIAVTLMVKAYADFGNASQLLEFLKDIPQDLLGQSSTWSAVISAFSRQWGWGSDGDLDSRDAAFGLSCAVLDQVPVKAEALPAALREEFPFVGLRPPIPEAGLMLVIFDLATRLRGERGQIITEKGRGYLVRNGHRVPDGADARAMLATVKLSLPGSRPRQRRR